MIEVLRTDMSSLYSVQVGLGRNSLSRFGHITLSFYCNPENMDWVYDCVEETLQGLRDNGPPAGEVDTIRKSLQHSHQVALKNNSYWLFWILDAFKSMDLSLLEDDGIGPESNRDEKGEGEEERMHKRVLESISSRSIFLNQRIAELVNICSLQRYVQELFPPDAGVRLKLLPPETSGEGSTDREAEATGTEEVISESKEAREEKKKG